MTTLTQLAGVLTVACGLWLIGLALALLFKPAAARRFLGKFASSARAHFTEQLLRLAAGAAHRRSRKRVVSLRPPEE